MKIIKNTIVLLFIGTVLVSTLHAGDLASARIGFFGGLSGTSFVIFLLDLAAEADGKVVETAGEYGLLTGEFGVAADFRFLTFGVRLEGLFGYYKYNVFEFPNTSYTMLMCGVEPYLYLDGLIFGVGSGVFYSVMQEEFLNIQVSEGESFTGSGFWVSSGFELDENLELNFRVRWHHFYRGKEIDQSLDDYAVVVRFIVWF